MRNTHNHKVHPVDAYDDMWRCSCGQYFESLAGFAICPRTAIKGHVVKFGRLWFYHVKAGNEILFMGQTDSWQEAFSRTFRHVSAMRPS